MSINKYVNIESLNLNEIMNDIYFRSYLFEYQSIEKMNYINENSIIYLNSNINNEIQNINFNIKNLITNRSTIIKIMNFIPNNINKIITGDLIIDNFQENKFKYYCWLSDNDDEILKYLNQNQDKILEIVNIKNIFNDSCLMELTLNKCFNSIKYILDYLKHNYHTEFINLINSYNFKNKTSFGKMVEYNFYYISEYSNYILDSTLQLIEENNNSNLTLELLYKGKFDIAFNFINRLKQFSPQTLLIRDNIYNKNIMDFCNNNLYKSNI